MLMFIETGQLRSLVASNWNSSFETLKLHDNSAALGHRDSTRLGSDFAHYVCCVRLFGFGPLGLNESPFRVFKTLK